MTSGAVWLPALRLLLCDYAAFSLTSTPRIRNGSIRAGAPYRGQELLHTGRQLRDTLWTIELKRLAAAEA